MNISGIRPVFGFYSEKISDSNRISSVVAKVEPPQRDDGAAVSISSEGRIKAFGSYDVDRQHRPSEGIKPAGVDRSFSRAEVNRAVDVMKRDGSLHKYQTFVGTQKREPLIRTGEIENFVLS